MAAMGKGTGRCSSFTANRAKIAGTRHSARQMQAPAGFHVQQWLDAACVQMEKLKASWGAPTVQIPPDLGMKHLGTGWMLASHPLPLFVFHILVSDTRWCSHSHSQLLRVMQCWKEHTGKESHKQLLNWINNSLAMVTPESRAILPKQVFPPPFALQANEVCGGDKLCRRGRKYKHWLEMRPTRCTECSCTMWHYRGPYEISSSFPHDERPLLRNSVTMTERLRDAGMEANAKYYPVSLIGISPYLWLLKYPLTYSSLTSPRLDGFPSSRLKDSVVSRKVTVISVER